MQKAWILTITVHISTTDCAKGTGDKARGLQSLSQETWANSLALDCRRSPVSWGPFNCTFFDTTDDTWVHPQICQVYGDNVGLPWQDPVPLLVVWSCNTVRTQAVISTFCLLQGYSGLGILLQVTVMTRAVKPNKWSQNQESKSKACESRQSLEIMIEIKSRCQSYGQEQAMKLEWTQH